LSLGDEVREADDGADSSRHNELKL
jgi:hypothetical protein